MYIDCVRVIVALLLLLWWSDRSKCLIWCRSKADMVRGAGQCRAVLAGQKSSTTYSNHTIVHTYLPTTAFTHTQRQALFVCLSVRLFHSIFWTDWPLNFVTARLGLKVRVTGQGQGLGLGLSIDWRPSLWQVFLPSSAARFVVWMTSLSRSVWQCIVASKRGPSPISACWERMRCCVVKIALYCRGLHAYGRQLSACCWHGRPRTSLHNALSLKVTTAPCLQFINDRSCRYIVT